MKYAEDASNEVGQYYVYSTFDLGVCMKAFPLLWNFPDKFERHIVLIGTFHLNMGYFKMVGRKMDGSGIDHILIESNIISPGSIKGVLSGKNYNRATYSHKILFESLHRLLMEEFMKRQHEDVLCSIKNLILPEET